MFSPMKAVLLASAAVLSLAIAAPASAVPITTNLVNGPLTFSLDTNGCIASACANLTWITSGNGFLLQNGTGSAPIETAPGVGNGNAADFTLNFTVTSSIANYLSGVNVSVDGSGSLTAVTDSFAAFSGFASAASSGDTRNTATASKSFSPRSSVQVAADIKAASFSSPGATVYTVTQTFSVPEPASMGLLGVGLVSLAAARRRASRPAA